MGRPDLHARADFYRRCKLVATILPLAVLLQGCAIFGGSARSGGSKLSDAAREAKPAEKKDENKKVDKKQRRLEAGERADQPEVTATDESSELAPSPPNPSGPRAPFGTISTTSRYHRFHVGLLAGGGFIGGNHYGGYGSGGIEAGVFPLRRTRLDLGLLFSDANLTAASGLRESFKNTAELTADLSGRYYLTPENTLVGVYPMVGLQYGSLSWDYARPLAVEEEGRTRTVDNDFVSYWAPYVGLGTSLVQTRHVHLGGRVITGLRVYGSHTNEGFQNDIFKATGFVQFLFEMTGLL